MNRQIIKFINRASINKNESRYKAQLPAEQKYYGNCEFNFDASCDKYDWLVVIDDIPKTIKNRTEDLKCPKENTILITTEPNTITKYGKAFAGQFKYLITNQEDKYLPHPNAQRSQTGNLWFYDKNLDEILSNTKPNKTKKISTVCSNKQQGHTVHKRRFDFTKILQDEIPNLKRFGKGFNWIDLKCDAIDDYEFHVAVENHYAKDVWTEKLADTFLGYAVPIYYGCPNVYNYFPEDSIILIDIFDEENSIRKIKEIISTPGEYERRLPAIIEARRRVIEEYNIMAMIDKIVSSHDYKNESSVSNKNKIFNRRIMRTKYLPDLFSFIGWKVKNFILNSLQ